MSDPRSLTSRNVRWWAAGTLALALSSCAGSPGSVEVTRLALEDPDGVIGQIDGNLQILVMPGASHTCLGFAGVLDPPPPIDGPVDGFIRDEVLELEGSATLSVPPGNLSILIRGRDADGVLVATGCEDVTLAAGETRTIGITVRRAVVTGVCGNGDIEVGESCDDGDDPEGRLTPGDGCDELCQTEPFNPETEPAASAGGRELAPAAGWSDGGLLVTGWHVTTGGRNVRFRLYDAAGGIDGLTSGLQVAVNAESRPGNQADIVLAERDGRVAAAWTDLATDAGDVRVQVFRTESLRGVGPDSVLATSEASGTQRDASVAFDDAGRVLVAFADSAASSGIHGRAYTAETLTPLSADPIPLATGASAGAPAVASTGAGWLLAYEAPVGNVRVQRIGADGNPTGDDVDVLTGDDVGGVQGSPAIAALPGGPALVVWRDDRETPDGAGTSIRGRLFGADGAAVGPVLSIDTTAGTDRSEPTVAAANGVFVVAWNLGSAEIRGRFLDGEGTFLLNRDRFPSSTDFVITDGGDVSAPSAGAGGDDQVVIFWVADGETVWGRLFAAPQ